MKTIGEILDEMETPEGQAKEAHREASFRRGYHHGYANAIDAIFALWRSGMPVEDAYKMCALHENGIAYWRTRFRDGFSEPPPFRHAALEEGLTQL